MHLSVHTSLVDNKLTLQRLIHINIKQLVILYILCIIDIHMFHECIPCIRILTHSAYTTFIGIYHVYTNSVINNTHTFIQIYAYTILHICLYSDYPRKCQIIFKRINVETCTLHTHTHACAHTHSQISTQVGNTASKHTLQAG